MPPASASRSPSRTPVYATTHAVVFSAAEEHALRAMRLHLSRTFPRIHWTSARVIRTVFNAYRTGRTVDDMLSTALGHDAGCNVAPRC